MRFSKQEGTDENRLRTEGGKVRGKAGIEAAMRAFADAPASAPGIQPDQQPPVAETAPAQPKERKTSPPPTSPTLEDVGYKTNLTWRQRLGGS